MRSNLLMIVMMIFVGCSDVEAKDNSNITNRVLNKAEQMEKEPVVDHSMFKYTHVDPVQINLDDMPFVEAFRIQHRAKGEGHTFWWNGDEYTTDLNVSQPLERGRWVTNSDDKDDTCYENWRDECGVCNGEGPTTWYLDLDGDGLGDPNTWTKECTYPSVDEE